MLGTGPLLGQALQNAWDKPAFGTGPSTCLGHARSWGRLFNMLGICLLLGHALPVAVFQVKLAYLYSFINIAYNDRDVIGSQKV